MARQALSSHEFSSNMMISSAVAHVAALFKNHLPDIDVEIFRKDIVRACETLVTRSYDATQDFVSSCDFTSLTKSEDTDSPRNL
jgi:hypothetical protein